MKDIKKLEDKRKMYLKSIKTKLAAYEKFVNSNYGKKSTIIVKDDSIHWGHIGDLSRIDEHLSELEFILD